MAKRKIIIDSFAGGGGASTGIKWALGRGPDVAVNHEPHYASAMVPIDASKDRDSRLHREDGVNELGEDFWLSVVKSLEDRDAHVVLRVFRDGKKQNEVAREMGLSKQRVGQLYERALLKLSRRKDLEELARAA